MIITIKKYHKLFYINDKYKICQNSDHVIIIYYFFRMKMIEILLEKDLDIDCGRLFKGNIFVFLVLQKLVCFSLMINCLHVCMHY